jgi:pimeloyl-ACP methyl ester carboxylesterase
MLDKASFGENTSVAVVGGPTIVTVPCFSGAPWDQKQLESLAPFPVRTMRLPERLDSVDRYADYVGAEVADLDDYVLAGDSFGAVIALSFALRAPSGLRALVMSGGFAADPLPRWKANAARASKYAVGPLYRQGTLRFHASQLASKFDADAEVPHRQADYRDLFVINTPRVSYSARVVSVIGFDVRAQLGRITVPTLLITPEDDHLVGRDAARDLVTGIPHAEEIVLARSGHMFRFTEPTRYGSTISRFVSHLPGATTQREVDASSAP